MECNCVRKLYSTVYLSYPFFGEFLLVYACHFGYAYDCYIALLVFSYIDFVVCQFLIVTFYLEMAARVQEFLLHRNIGLLAEATKSELLEIAKRFGVTLDEKSRKSVMRTVLMEHLIEKGGRDNYRPDEISGEVEEEEVNENLPLLERQEQNDIVDLEIRKLELQLRRDELQIQLQREEREKLEVQLQMQL